MLIDFDSVFVGHVDSSLWVLMRTYTNITFYFLPPSLKLECEKLASEKTEMQRHYVMVSLTDWLCSHLYFCHVQKEE